MGKNRVSKVFRSRRKTGTYEAAETDVHEERRASDVPPTYDPPPAEAQPGPPSDKVPTVLDMGGPGTTSGESGPRTIDDPMKQSGQSTKAPLAETAVKTPRSRAKKAAMVIQNLWRKKKAGKTSDGRASQRTAIERDAARLIQMRWGKRKRARKIMSTAGTQLKTGVKVVSEGVLNVGGKLAYGGVHIAMRAKIGLKARVHVWLKRQLRDYYVNTMKLKLVSSPDFPWVLRYAVHDFVDGVWEHISQEILRKVHNIEDLHSLLEEGSESPADSSPSPQERRFGGVRRVFSSKEAPLLPSPPPSPPDSNLPSDTSSVAVASSSSPYHFLAWLRRDLTRVKIKMVVKCANGLPNADGTFYPGLEGFDLLHQESDLTDAYAIVRLGREKRKTKTFPNSLNPEWNHSIDFRPMLFGDIVREPLQIEIFDEDLTNPDDHIGTAFDDKELMWQLCCEGGTREVTLPISPQGTISVAVTVLELKQPTWLEWIATKLDPAIMPVQAMAREIWHVL